MNTQNESSRHNIPYCTYALLAGITFALIGCAGADINRDYAEASKAYWLSTDQQLLRNLVHLRFDEPPFFLQLGQTTSQDMFSGSLGFSPGNVTTTHPNGTSGPWNSSGWTLGGSTMGSLNQSTSVQLAPISGGTYGAMITKPIPDSTFYTLLEQGWPASAVARTLLNYVTVNKTIQYFNNPLDPTYGQFIDFCYALDNAQKARQLFEPTSRNPSDSNVVTFKDVKLAEAITAQQDGYSVKTNSDGTYQVNFGKQHSPMNGFGQYHDIALGMRTFMGVMRATAKEELLFNAVDKDPRYNADFYIDHELKQNMAEGPQGLVTYDDPDKLSVRINDMGAVRTVASSPTTSIQTTTHTLTFTPQGSSQSLMVWPILSLTKPDSISNLVFDELVVDHYKSRTFVVGDFYNPNDYPPASSVQYFQPYNRRVFALLAFLYGSASVDTKDLPVQQQIIQ